MGYGTKMQQHQNPVKSGDGAFSPANQTSLQEQLGPQENVLAVFPVDLNAQLQFAAGSVALTDQRLLVQEPSAHNQGSGQAWRAWPLDGALALRQFDHGGIGTVELHDASRRLATWRYTLRLHDQALRLVQLFEQQVQALRTGVAPQGADDGLAADGEEDFGVADGQAIPSTWVLLRLWRFAHPYRWQLALGFFLTMASTAATLIPPYLTIPLMDDILIPFQNGQQIAPGLVGMYLGARIRREKK